MMTEVQTTITETDEAKLKRFIDLLEDGIELTTGFIPDEDTGYLTHQVIRVSCGEFVTVSQPEPLVFPLTPAPIAETGITIN
jgi:hypothetical protein